MFTLRNPQSIIVLTKALTKVTKYMHEVGRGSIYHIRVSDLIEKNSSLVCPLMAVEQLKSFRLLADPPATTLARTSHSGWFRAHTHLTELTLPIFGCVIFRTNETTENGQMCSLWDICMELYRPGVTWRKIGDVNSVRCVVWKNRYIRRVYFILCLIITYHPFRFFSAVREFKNLLFYRSII